MRNLALWVAGAVLGTGCTAGSVTVPSGLDDFGPARSAVWLVLTQVDDGDVEQDHSFVMTTERNFCGKAQKAYPEVAEVIGGVYDSYQDVVSELYETYYGTSDYDAFYTALNRAMCDLYGGYFDDLGDATSGILGKGTTLNFHTFRNLGDGRDYVPVTGTYEMRDGGGPEPANEWRGSLTYSEENPYRAAAKAIADVDCDSLGAEDYWYEQFYDVFESFEPIDLRGGTLELTAEGDDKFKAEITNTAVDEVAGFEASGTFKRCDVSVDGYAYLPL